MQVNLERVPPMAGSWWAFVLRGALAILFGLAVILFPEIGLVTLVALFAVWMIADGAGAIVEAWNRRGTQNAWLGVGEGLLGIAVGILAIAWPRISALVLLLLVAAWAISTGILEIYAAVRFRERINGELWLGLAGLLSIGFGVLLILEPSVGLLSVLWLVGIYAIAFGAAMLLLGWRLRGRRRAGAAGGGYAGRMP
jgi:uncharacterized membrane protein HdeD (DUF308 family)